MVEGSGGQGARGRSVGHHCGGERGNQIDGDCCLEIFFAMNIVGDPGVPKEEIVQVPIENVRYRYTCVLKNTGTVRTLYPLNVQCTVHVHMY